LSPYLPSSRQPFHMPAIALFHAHFLLLAACEYVIQGSKAAGEQSRRVGVKRQA